MANPAPLNPRPMSRESYYALYRDTDAHVELIDGRVYEMPPPGPRHSSTITRLYRSLVRQLDELRYVVRQEQPITLPGDSDPEPDIVVAVGPESRYFKAHPRAGDVLLAIEVSDSTQEHDYGNKVPLYARYGIAEYWIINLDAKHVDIYRDPASDAGEYRNHIATTADAVTPAGALKHVAVRRDDLFID